MEASEPTHRVTTEMTPQERYDFLLGKHTTLTNKIRIAGELFRPIMELDIERHDIHEQLVVIGESLSKDRNQVFNDLAELLRESRKK